MLPLAAAHASVDTRCLQLRCAGDHLQLPPTVLSDEAARGGLGQTLFERLQARLGEAASVMLTVQYRMNAAIMDWSSQELYQVRGWRGAAGACVARTRA